MKRKWLVGGIIVGAIPYLLIFDDSFHDGFGPFYLVAFLMVLVPLSFGLGALIGLFFDKLSKPNTSKAFYIIYMLVTGFLSFFMLIIFSPNTADGSGFGLALKTIFLNPYHLPLYICLTIFILSIKQLRKLRRIRKSRG